MDEKFKCNCTGLVKELAPDRVLHTCANKYAPGTSFYDGIGKPIPYRRVQLNPKITEGEIRYSWFVDWQ